MIKRRAFVGLLGGAAAWPLTARAQQPSRMRRIGVMTQYREGDPIAALRIAAFVQRLRDLGWVEGRNLTIEYRWTAADPDSYRRLAAELVATQPDILVASFAPALAALLQATRTIPIVFTSILDPVGSGLIDSLARPGGNATGFMLFEYGLSGKWLDLLKQFVPQVTRVAVVRDPSSTGGPAQLGALQATAASLGIELRPIDSRDPAGFERTVAAFAQQPNGGLIQTADAKPQADRQTVIAAVARHKLPAIYPLRYYADEGGLMSYGPDQVELWRLAAGYVDRVLKGEKPAELAVQAPTKYEFVINLKTAKALGLTVPLPLRTLADEVIE
jgi:putative tryptophan/tyrosine transport system substrate-binding protein